MSTGDFPLLVKCQENILSHWQVDVLVLPERGYDDEEALTPSIMFKGVIFHADVKFHDKPVSNAPTKDISNNGQRILLAMIALLNLYRTLI